MTQNAVQRISALETDAYEASRAAGSKLTSGSVEHVASIDRHFAYRQSCTFSLQEWVSAEPAIGQAALECFQSLCWIADKLGYD